MLSKKKTIFSYNNIFNKKEKELEEDKKIEDLSKGPTKEDYGKNNIVYKDIVLESMKMGDIFPAYFAIVGFTNENENISFVADSPCELISMKLPEIKEFVPSVFKFLQQFAKPYPNDEFIRKFYLYNSIWINFKKTLKNNIVADYKNKKNNRK